MYASKLECKKTVQSYVIRLEFQKTKTSRRKFIIWHYFSLRLMQNNVFKETRVTVNNLIYGILFLNPFSNIDSCHSSYM